MKTPAKAPAPLPAQAVSVCICTYRRDALLAKLLDDLLQQSRPELIRELIVVDNDPAGSARATVEAAAARTVLPLRYSVQPEKNISLTRNQAVGQAQADWVAFIDDDERVIPQWVESHLATALRCEADGTMGPVIHNIPQEAPVWIPRGNIHGHPRYPDGTPMPDNKLFTSNALVRRSLLMQEPGPFDPAFGLTGGGDGDLFLRLRQRGGRFVHAAFAVAEEELEPYRLTEAWFLQRAERGGGDHIRHILNGRRGPVTPLLRLKLRLDVALKFLAAWILYLLRRVAGDDDQRFLARRRIHAQIGKWRAFGGRYHREYAAKPHG